MIVDNQYHFRLTPERYSGGTVPPLLAPEAFLTKRKLVKIPATDESEAVYYTVEDGLTIEEAIDIYYAQTGSGKLKAAYYDESGDRPVRVERIEDCDRVIFSLWGVYGSEMRAFIGAAEALGVNPDEVIIASGRPWNDYLSTLKLPID